MRTQGQKANLTYEDHMRMLEMYEQGVPSYEIAKEFGVNIKMLSYVRGKYGIKRRPMPKLCGDKHWNFRGGYSRSGKYLKVLLDRDSPFYPMADKKGYVLEHRLVMAKHLNRLLGADETVHHINGNKIDNRLGNLELRQGPHGRGISLRCAECGSTNLVPTELGE